MDVPRIVKPWRSIAIGGIVFAGLLIAAIFGIGWYIAPSEDLEKADLIVVVSGGETTLRTDEGIKLWKDGWAPRLAFAGAAADRGVSNAKVMKARAIRSGVPQSVIYTEEQSVNTEENAKFLRPVVDSLDAKKIILVSSPYHTRRVKTLFQKHYGDEYEFIARPAKDPEWARSSWWQSPETIYLTWDELRKTVYVVTFQRPGG